MGSYIKPDIARGVEDGAGAQAGFGFRMRPGVFMELTAFGHALDPKTGSGTWDTAGAGVDLNLLTDASDALRPFLLMGLGGVRDQPGIADEDFTSLYVNFGAGLLVRLGGPVHLRGEGRYVATFNDEIVAKRSVFEDGRASIGLLYAFGYDPEAPPPAPVPPPAPPPVIRDADGDGVPDNRDRCPDTPPGVRVGPDGCPIADDKDADGVKDKADKCPETPPRFQVRDSGCAYKQVIVFHNIQFEFDKARLMPQGVAVLRDIAKGLRGQPTMEVEIHGHASSEGTQAYNLVLSQKRANAVREFLIEQGIEPSRMSSEGYGEFVPIASNDSEPGREINRRVEFKIVRE